MKKDELEALVKEQHEQIQELQQALVASAGRSMGGWVREVEERLGADYQRLAGELKRTQAELATMTARARTAESEQERDLAAQKKLADDYRKLKNEHKSCPTNAQLEKAERERTRLKTQNEKLDLAAQKLRDAEQAWKTERARLLLDKTNLDKAFAEEKERCASLLLEKAMIEAKHAQLEADRANLEAQCAQLSEDKKNLEQECARLKEEKALLSSNGSLALQNAEARASQLTETNAALTKTNATIAEDKRLAEAAAEMLRTELARLRASHNQNCTDMRELADDLREMAAKDASWAAKTAGMQTRIDELEAERDEAVRGRERLENRLDAQKDELARAKERLDALRSVEKELRDCEEELASAQARIDALAPVEGRLQEALNQNAALAAQGQQLEQARHELEQTRRALTASQQNAAQQDPLHVQNLQNQLTYYMRISADARLSSTALATRVHGLEQTQAQYEERVQQYAAALNERSARVGVLEGQLAQVRGELQHAQAQHAQAQAQLQQTQGQLQQTHAHLAQVQGQLAGAQAQLADTQGQLAQAQGAEKVVRSQDSQTNPVLVLRLSRKELEEREAAKDGLVRAQIEDDKALVHVAQTDLDSNKIAELTAERDELLDRLKGLDVVQASMQEQLDAANRTTSVLRGEIARLNEIRYTTNASKTGDAPAAKPTLGPSNAANSVLDAGPSNPSVPAKSPSPGSKENILPQTSQSTSGAVPVAPEAIFGRVVLQCLRNLPWPAQGQMWLNMMVVLDPDSQVSLQTMRDLFVRDSGAMVGARDFGDMILALSAPLFPGKVLIADGVVTGIALREGVAQDGSQRPAAPVPVTPRGPPTVLPPPRSALPTPATAPRPPAPAGPRPLPPPRAAPPPPPPRTAPLPPPRTAHSPPPRVAPPSSPRAVPPSSVSRAALSSSPSVKTEPEAKRRAEEGDVSERPVKRSRFGYASSSSPAPPSSPAAVASSPTDRIASSNRFAPQNSSQRAAATPLINRTAPSGRFGPLNPLPRVAATAAAPATKTGSSTQSGTVKPATPTSAASPKPTSTPPRAGPSSQPAQTRTAPSSPGKVVPPSSSSQPAARARAAPATQVQSPPPLHPEHRRQAVWDIDKSDVEDLFVLWLRQGALRDISSHVTRGVAVQRAADALRRLGWASQDDSNFVVSATSREYRHARFGKLTIAKALGFIDF